MKGLFGQTVRSRRMICPWSDLAPHPNLDGFSGVFKLLILNYIAIQSKRAYMAMTDYLLNTNSLFCFTKALIRRSPRPSELSVIPRRWGLTTKLC